MKRMMVACLSGFLIAAPMTAVSTELATEKQKFSYAMGVNLGNLMRSQGISDVDIAALTAGFDDILNEKQLRLGLSEMKQAIENRQQQLQAEAAQAAEQKKQAGLDFLDANKSKQGVQVLDNGLQYLVIKPGDGKQPKLTDTVKVHYHGTLTDGTVFDSSVDRGEPASFSLERVIPGFHQAISQMKTGGKWKVFVPPELGYGESGAGNMIGPNETLIFEIELLAIE